MYFSVNTKITSKEIYVKVAGLNIEHSKVKMLEVKFQTRYKRRNSLYYQWGRFRSNFINIHDNAYRFWLEKTINILYFCNEMEFSIDISKLKNKIDEK